MGIRILEDFRIDFLKNEGSIVSVGILHEPGRDNWVISREIMRVLIDPSKGNTSVRINPRQLVIKCGRKIFAIGINNEAVGKDMMRLGKILSKTNIGLSTPYWAPDGLHGFSIN